jgi:hypothetical protein
MASAKQGRRRISISISNSRGKKEKDDGTSAEQNEDRIGQTSESRHEEPSGAAGLLSHPILKARWAGQPCSS